MCMALFHFEIVKHVRYSYRWAKFCTGKKVWEMERFDPVRSERIREALVARFLWAVACSPTRRVATGSCRKVKLGPPTRALEPGQANSSSFAAPICGTQTVVGSCSKIHTTLLLLLLQVNRASFCHFFNYVVQFRYSQLMHTHPVRKLYSYEHL